MPDYELISPFPESELPALYRWIQPYADKTEYHGLTVDEFVAKKYEEQLTWGIRLEGEIGGYVKFDLRTTEIGTAEVLCKPYFFRLLRQTAVLPAVSEVLTQVFNDGIDIVLFTPLERNKSMVNLLKTLGARDAGAIAANGIPERRVLAIGSGDWKPQTFDYNVDASGRLIPESKRPHSQAYSLLHDQENPKHPLYEMFRGQTKPL